MNLQLCACCLLFSGLCTCNRLSKAEEPENNLGLRSLHMTTSGKSLVDADTITDMKGYSITEGSGGRVIDVVGASRLRRCSLNLCCPNTLYCCSGLTCCKGNKRTPQKPCFNP